MSFNLTRRTMMGGAAALAASSMLPSSAHAATVLRYGNAGASTTLSNTFNATLSETLSKATDGDLSFEIFAGTLGGEKQLIESMALGSLDMYNGAYTGTDEFDIFYSPYFFRDGKHAKAVMESEIGAQASKALEDRYRARLLGVGRLGGYNLMLKEPVEKLSDIKGRKIRTPQIKGCVEGVAFFEGVPTPIPFNEVYLALQSGIVDGLLTALNPAVQFKFYEVCKHVVVPDFGLALDKQAISTRSWGGLPADQQELLVTSFNDLEEVSYYEAGLASKQTDLEAWAGANGDDALLNIDASNLVAELEPLNRRLADEVYGAGAWEKIQAAGA